MKSDKDWRADWGELHRKYIKMMSPCERNSKMADYCEEMMTKAKVAYYAGDPIMSDHRYDWLEDALKSLRPDSYMLEAVGAPVDDIVDNGWW